MSEATTIRPTGRAHPAAAIFPLLSAEEMNDLVADIRANGLLHPIVLDDEGTIIDGRNRNLACIAAGVEPRYERLNGRDPVEYILSANIHRRNLSKGQRTLASVILKLESDSNFARGEALALAADLNTTRRYVDMAQAVAAVGADGEPLYPDLIERVMAEPLSRPDVLSLPAAYQSAKDRADADERAHMERVEAHRLLGELEAHAEDLATLVRDGLLPLREAMAVWRQRKQEARERAERQTARVAGAVSDLWSTILTDPARIADAWVPEAIPRRDIPEQAHLWTAAGLREVAGQLDALADAFGERGIGDAKTEPADDPSADGA